MMRDYIKLLLRVAVILICINANGQIEKGFLFNYEGSQVVVFEHKKNVSLEFVGAQTEALNLNYVDFFHMLEKVYKIIPYKKGDVVQLYLYTNENSQKQVYINLLDKKRIKGSDYRNNLVYLCLGDCGKINELHKIFVYTIDNMSIKQYN